MTRTIGLTNLILKNTDDWSIALLAASEESKSDEIRYQAFNGIRKHDEDFHSYFIEMDEDIFGSPPTIFKNENGSLKDFYSDREYAGSILPRLREIGREISWEHPELWTSPRNILSDSDYEKIIQDCPVAAKIWNDAVAKYVSENDITLHSSVRRPEEANPFARFFEEHADTIRIYNEKHAPEPDFTFESKTDPVASYVDGALEALENDDADPEIEDGFDFLDEPEAEPAWGPRP